MFRTFDTNQTSGFRSTTAQRTLNYTGGVKAPAPSHLHAYNPYGYYNYPNRYALHYGAYPYYYSASNYSVVYGTYSTWDPYYGYYGNYGYYPSYLGINLANNRFHLGINLAAVNYSPYYPYTYYYGGRYRSYVSSYGYHRYSFGRRSYRFYRPVYYTYSTNYNWDYDGYDYVSNTRSYLVRDEDAIDAANEEGFVEGYRDGYYDGAMNETIYGGSDRRTTLERSPRAAKSSLFTTAWSNRADLGYDEYARGEYNNAVKNLQDAAIANPTSSTLKRDLGQSAFAAGRFELAAFSMRRAIQLNTEILDESPSPRAQIGDYIIYDQQRERLEAQIKADPRAANLYFLLGVQRYLTNDFSQAAQSFEAAKTLDARDELASALYKQAADRAKE